MHTLGDAIDTAGVWVRIVDDKTGNVISGAWDQIPPEYRKKIIGLADLGEMGVTLYVPASAMAKVIQGVKVAEDAGKAVTLGVDAAKGAKSVGGETAKNIVNGLSLKTELALKEGNILGNDGKLTKWAIETALKIRLEAGGIKNPSIIKALTKDGSSIKDWSKFKARTVSGPNESRLQVHFYKNLRTGKVDYETVDFKVKVVVPAIPKKPMP
ncbi:hypothetical protein [Varunaivibrio sulfuroxidans]|uniref:hypothetical protein n=1 Tax=Varunaivibrio sulfuroxidans TaxID=1773489 RepID=UPI0023E0A19D|nr:hypothetical protein [Varunaivibrio sulfuroxidans]WES32012.1 hypothetical protein P3M64_06560 [Varunaivibrio sulfuroxidans]